MRYVLTAYENEPESIPRKGMEPGAAGCVKVTMAFDADYLPNVLEQFRLFLHSAGFDYLGSFERLESETDA